MFYTYIWKDSAGVPFYVGKGRGRRCAEVYECRRSADFKAEYAKGGCTVEIADEFIHETEALAHEVELIARYGRRDIGTGILVNRTDGGEGQSGRLISLETREKLRRANTGKRHTQETRSKMSDAQRGRTIKPETRAKISESRTGIVFSDKHRENIGLSQLGHSRWRGKRHTPETIEKFRALHSNRTAETRAKISASLSGRELESGHKENIAAGMRNSKPRGAFKGVCFDKAKGRWMSRIKVGGKTRNLGRFTTPEEAARAYDKAAIEAWGIGNCYLNHPDEHKVAEECHPRDQVWPDTEAA